MINGCYGFMKINSHMYVKQNEYFNNFLKLNANFLHRKWEMELKYNFN